MEVFGRLLTHNSHIPVFGYKEGKSLNALEILGPALPDEFEPEKKIRGVDWILFPELLPHGRFKIANRKVGEGRTIEFECVWVSGPNVGKVFGLKKAGFVSIEDIRQSFNGQEVPSSLYLPPLWLITVLELVGSGAAILTFFNLSLGWIKPLTEKIRIFFDSIVTP